PYSTSVSSIRERVRYALLKDTYWRLLSDPENVTNLLNLIETHWFSKTSNSTPPNFWWVNQGKTYRVEKEGGFVWAPQNNKSGNTFFHWENVSKIQRGDVLFNYANGSVVAVSLADTSGYERTRPQAIHEDAWDEQGWSTDCSYHELNTPIELDQVARPIRDLQLSKGPINSAAAVNQGYLFLLSKAAAQIITQQLDLSELPQPLQTILFALLEKSRVASLDPPERHTTVFHELNVILYGPPGTGKTYDTIQKAVEICDEGSVPDDRAEVVARFNQLRDDSRIEFVTFHQSYGYEDFVEGIRPVLLEGESDSEADGSQVRYECRDGVFKRLCKLAIPPKGHKKQGANFDPDKTVFWKMSLGRSTAADSEIYEECIENNYILMG
ncbi:MAG: hypothetical protein ACWGQW_23980, partial [bacterium]